VRLRQKPEERRQKKERSAHINKKAP